MTDDITTIELWYPEARPSYIAYTANGELSEIGPTLGADEAYCDLCNADIPIRPVPMIGSYALCLECLAKVVPSWKEMVPAHIQYDWQDQETQNERNL